MLKRFSLKKREKNALENITSLKEEGLKGEVKVTGLPPIAIKESKKKEEKIELTSLKKEGIKPLAAYNFVSDNIPITINIYKKKGEFVPIYEVSISSISKNTEIILEKIREELTSQVSLGMVDILTTKDTGIIEQRFMDAITTLVNKHFPDANETTANFLKSYLVQRSLGLGSIEILMDDINLEEIAINDAEEPVWVYHVKFGWLKTTIMLASEDQIRHYATMIAFAKHFVFKIKTYTNEPDTVKVTVVKGTSGIAGGLVGMKQVKNELTRISNVLETI